MSRRVLKNHIALYAKSAELLIQFAERAGVGAVNLFAYPV